MTVLFYRVDAVLQRYGRAIAEGEPGSLDLLGYHFRDATPDDLTILFRLRNSTSGTARATIQNLIWAIEIRKQLGFSDAPSWEMRSSTQGIPAPVDGYRWKPPPGFDLFDDMVFKSAKAVHEGPSSSATEAPRTRERLSLSR